MSKLWLCTFIVFYLLTSISTRAEIQNNTPLDTHKHLFLSSTKQGERLFKGLNLQKNNLKTCISCHTIEHTDTLNWNPSARAIAFTFAEKTINEFKITKSLCLTSSVLTSHIT